MRTFFSSLTLAVFLAEFFAGWNGRAGATPEVRGTWLTTAGNAQISDPAHTAATMKRLREIGLNTVYVECWENGGTEFPSAVMNQATGVPLRVRGAAAAEQRDLLEETLNAAQREGLIYFAWFEFGFAAGTRRSHNELREKHPDWLMTARDGRTTSRQNPFIWLNPLRPECRKLLQGIVLEAITNYDLDGVQLDDHMAWPVTMGYDPYTIKVYQAEHAGKSPATNFNDPEWVAWRAGKITEFARELDTACKAANPHILVSISPAIAPWALENYACDWPRWAQAGWMDEFVPQDYRFDYNAFASTWREQARSIPGRKKDLIAGMLIEEGDKVNSWADLARELELVRATARGHVWWYSRGVVDIYAKEIAAFYDVAHQGQAPHPKFGMNQRPPPCVLHQQSDARLAGATTLWTGEDIPAGTYRVIGRWGDAWKTIGSVSVTNAISGKVAVTNANAARVVELLVDRRKTVNPGIQK